MSDHILQCKSCGARILQTVYPGAEPMSCPKCKNRNWVEIRGYNSNRDVQPEWLDDFLNTISGPRGEIRWL